jgi:hypothetical protein
MNRLLAITLAAAVAGCVSDSQTDAISDDGMDPTILYVDGTWTPLDAGDRVIKLSLPPDYWLTMITDRAAMAVQQGATISPSHGQRAALRYVAPEGLDTDDP